MARPRYNPTDNERITVKMASGFGLRHDDICKLILTQKGQPIAAKTLRKYFHNELTEGRALARFTILGCAFQVATDVMHPRFAAMNIWAQKSQMGITELSAFQPGPDGQPLANVPMLTVICGKE